MKSSHGATRACRPTSLSRWNRDLPHINDHLGQLGFIGELAHSGDRYEVIEEIIWAQHAALLRILKGNGGWKSVLS